MPPSNKVPSLLETTQLMANSLKLLGTDHRRWDLALPEDVAVCLRV